MGRRYTIKKKILHMPFLKFQDRDRIIPVGRDLGRFLVYPAALEEGSAARSDQVA